MSPLLCRTCLTCIGALCFSAAPSHAQVIRKHTNRIAQQQEITVRTREALAISGLSNSGNAGALEAMVPPAEAPAVVPTSSVKPSSVNYHRQAIPKIIHHTYSTQPNSTGFHEVFFNVSYFSFKRFFPETEYKYMFHTDAELERCIGEHFPRFLPEFLGFGTKADGHASIEKADAGRYCILWKYGGIYADLDYEVFRSFYDHLAPGRVNLNESPYEENEKATVQVQNALLAAPPRHPFWLHVFEQMGKDGMHLWNTSTGTGPKMISLLASQHRDEIHVLPCQHFQRLHRCGDPCDFDQVFAVHWNVNSYTGFTGVPNIWYRQKAAWKHYHPTLPFPWVPASLVQPLKGDSMKLRTSFIVEVIFLLASITASHAR